MPKTKQAMKKQSYVVVRTYSAGVHVGYLVARDGKDVTLRDARRIWSWVGARTLSEVATAGITAGPRVSVAVPSITLTEATEIIETTEAGAESLRGATWQS